VKKAAPRLASETDTFVSIPATTNNQAADTSKNNQPSEAAKWNKQSNAIKRVDKGQVNVAISSHSMLFSNVAIQHPGDNR
jgi:hypothetical protein